jgi:hypothetical protein
MNEYSSGDIMAAVLALQDATATGLSSLETRLNARIDNIDAKLTARIDSTAEGLLHEMNRRFDKVDLRFDAIDLRFDELELREGRPPH